MHFPTHILNESLDCIGSGFGTVMEGCFNRLFKRQPHLEKRFQKVSLPDLQTKIIQTFLVVVRCGNEPLQLTRFLQTLGEGHSQFGVSLQEYESFAEALMQSLEEHLGDKWTLEYQTAWGDLIDLIISLMHSGAREQIQQALRESASSDHPFYTSEMETISNSPEWASKDLLVPNSVTAVPKLLHKDAQAMLDQLPCCVAMTNAEQKLTYFNQAAIIFLDTELPETASSSGDLLGQSARQLFENSNMPGTFQLRHSQKTINVQVTEIYYTSNQFAGLMGNW